jgi:hypothetical protein
MPHSFYPDMSKHSQIKDLASKKRADKYIRVGWELIETFTERGLSQGETIMMYRIGWPRGTGQPIELPDDDDPLQIDPGPSSN